MIYLDTLVKTIELDDAVHKRLAKHEGIGETVQDVIIRLLDYYDKGRKGKIFGDPFETPKGESLELPDEDIHDKLEESE
jgi:predicted CopG family antitoxin